MTNVPLARRIRAVQPSLTLSIAAKAKKLQAQGINVISFSAGEPDFDTPEFVKQAAIESLEKGFTKYTPSSGTAELRAAISEKLKNENQLSYQPNQIIVSCGAKHSIYNVLQVLVDEGDEVIVPAPYWLSYPEMVTLAGGKSVFVETKLERNYQFTLADLEKAITPKTKVLILNSPSNPTGTVYELDFLKEIVKIAKRHSFFIVSDEIYEKLVYDGRKHYSIGSLDPEILNRTITIGGASKAYAMTGWRLGFAACPKLVADACDSLQSHSTSNPTSFAQVGYLEAIKKGEEDVKKMCASFEERRDLIYDLMKDIPKLRFFKPQGAFYFFIDIRDTGMTSIPFSERLLEEAQVAVVPGIAFGNDQTVRLSFACSERSIQEGVERIRNWMKKL